MKKEFLGLFVWLFTDCMARPMQDLQKGLEVSNWGTEYECGWIGVYCNWDYNVTSISLTGLNFAGTIPSMVFPYLTKLKVFSAVNVLSLSQSLNLPSDFCDANSLTQVEIFNFTLTSFPSQLLKCTKLEILHLAYCKISGTLPDFSPLVNLKILDLNNNAFTGNIPISLFSNTNLEILNLFHNELTGSVSDFVSTKLKVLDVRYNQFSGTISVSLYLV